MGFSLSAAHVISGIAILLMIEILISSTLPSIMNIQESFEDFRNRAIDTIKMKIDITNVELVDVYWWDENWYNRKNITISNNDVDGDLINFPVLIHITDTNLRDKAQPDGDDIVFIDNTNTIKYNHQIEFFNNGTGELLAWVNITYLSSTENNYFFMYYNNSESGNQQNPEGVWDSNYRCVYHMNNSVSLNNLTDSTINNFDSISFIGTPDYQQIGKIGNSIYYEDTEIHRLPDNLIIPPSNLFTISCWINFNSLNRDKHYAISFMENTFIRIRANKVGTIYYAELNIDNGVETNAQSTIELTNGSWYYLVGTYDGSTITLFTNASDAQSVASSTPIQDNKQNRIGNINSGRDGLYGYIDEIRYSDINRSQDWITTEYRNQNNPADFTIFQNEEIKIEQEISLKITIQNNGETKLLTDDFNILVDGVITSFNVNSSYILKDDNTMFFVGIDAAEDKLIKVISEYGISDYYEYKN